MFHTSILRRKNLTRVTTIGGVVLAFVAVWLMLAAPRSKATSYGTLVAWGDNSYGQVTGTPNLSAPFYAAALPVIVNGEPVTDLKAFAGGAAHTLVVKNDGTVLAWGLNNYGQTNVPGGLSGVTAVAAGEWHSVALKDDGTVEAWGANTGGCFPNCGQSDVPSGLSGVTAIAAGRVFTAALKGDGTVVVWGEQGYGFGATTVPVGLSDVKAISAGPYHMLALKTDGTVVAWGFNDFGGTDVPVGLSGVKAISAGFRFSAALKNDGTVVVWGGEGQASIPPGLSNVQAIASNAYDIQALKWDGTVVTWGANYLDSGVLPPGMDSLTAIAPGGTFTLGLTGPPSPPPTPTPTPTPAQTADLSITKTDNQTTAASASLVTYTIVATNSGPNDVVGANVTDNFPAEIANVNWSCIASPGSSCVPGGNGNINASVNLPANGTVTFTATGTVTATGGTLTNMASVTHSSVTDPVPQNNNAYDVDTITCPTVVTNTADSGPGTLRQAMICANAHPGPDTVIFNIPVSDPGFLGTIFRIRPLSALPLLIDSGTTIDGSTQTAFAGDTNAVGPEVVVNGSLSPDGRGFRIFSGINHINGLVINGFSNSGIIIEGAAAVGNLITGCYIGTNSSGLVANPNAFDGVDITAFASNNVIGGTTPQARNVISGNTRYGVLIYGQDGNVPNNLVIGNYIGTNAAGNAAIGNEMGVVFVSANSNFVGGSGPGAGNLISGNIREGIHSNSSSNQTIQGNYIGTNATGTAAIPNGFLGVNLFTGGAPSANNLIGGSVPGAGNLISGNVASGIGIGGNGSDHNIIQGNRVGTDASGNTAIGNSGGGIGIGTAGNLIGGTSTGARNVISGNGNAGVIIYGDTATGNLVQGNFIGTNAIGSAAILNNNPDFGGLLVIGAPNNLIGGSVPGAGNLISGNGDFGIKIDGPTGTGNQIQGNLVGTNAAGNASIGNGGSGIDISTVNNLIGGTSAGARNVISGNSGDGINILGNSSSGNRVQGNFVGTNAAGNASIPNFRGINITSGGNTIGGTSDLSRNIISGNAVHGLRLASSNATSNIVQGNFIGTDVSGNVALGNIAGTGIFVVGGASGNQIGGIGLGDGNVVSGNGSHGIWFRGVGTSNNSIQGNFVGTNAMGSTAIPNQSDGIRFDRGATYNLVGGTVPGTRNIISSNLGHGIHIDNISETEGIPGLGTGHIKVQGNFIGTGVNGTTPLGNRLPGVIIFGGSSDNLIGGTEPGAGNVIAFTTGGAIDDGAGGFITLPGSGISVANDANVAGDAGGSTSLHNRISQNSIFSNNGLGIDLSNLGIMPDPTQGPTANDPCDTDAGANNFQNFPLLTSFSESGGIATVHGTLNGTANTIFTIEFFANTVGDPSGNGEGQNYIGSTTVTTDSSCNATFSFTGPAPMGQYFVTATATDPDGNTSEFSAFRRPDTVTTITSVSPDPTLVGHPYTVNVSVASQAQGDPASPSGTVTISDGLGDSCVASVNNAAASCQITTNISGSVTLTAVYSGDGNFAGSTGTSAISIGKVPTTTLVTFEAGPYVFRGSPFTATARVTGAGGLDQSVPVTYSGNCTFVTVPLGCTATATFAETANYLGSSDSKSITISSACSFFDGFKPPIGGAVEKGTGGSSISPVRSFKLGSTIPVKFSATCYGAPLTTGVHVLHAQKWNNGTSILDDPIDATPTDAATTGAAFRLTGTEWHYNLDTKNTPGFSQGTWLLKATLFDGSTYSVWVAIKK